MSKLRELQSSDAVRKIIIFFFEFFRLFIIFLGCCLSFQGK